MSRSVILNSGLLLQTCGLITLIPGLIGLYFNETEALASVLLCSISFYASGFLLNVFSERKELNYKYSCSFIIFSFILMTIIGSIPYINLNSFNSLNILDRFTNALFESISGFTTTGFSFVSESDILPRTILVYRSLTELMGGVGIVYIFFAFFHTNRSLDSLGKVVGIDIFTDKIKNSYLLVFVIYGIYIIFFTLIVYILGIRDFLLAFTFVIDTLTGGFSPSRAMLQQILSIPMKICLVILMLLGSVNFLFNYYLITFNLKKAIPNEVKLYFGIIAVSTILVSVLSGTNFLDSLFHVVSMSSSTGFDYIGIPMMNETVLSIFIFIMILGGCSFSMAGGIKISRINSFSTEIKNSLERNLKKINQSINEDQTVNRFHYSVIVPILLFVGTLFVFSSIFSTIGITFENALFEMGSALSTNGISMGITTKSMPNFYKYLLMIAMIVGRIEIMPFIIAIKTHILPLYKNILTILISL